MDYKSANEQLQGRNKDSRKLANNTYLHRDGENIAIRLHNTDIVTFKPNGDTVLNTGGWRTLTTKTRINDYIGRYRVAQENGQWFVYDFNLPNPWYNPICMFADGMIIKKNGKIVNAEPISKAKENLLLRRKAQRYAAKYIAAFKNGEVPAPNGDDCWLCLGKTQSDNHILSHIEENYFVPSLLRNALEAMPSSIAMKDAVARKWNGQDVGWPDFIYKQLQKNLSRYVVRQLGQAS